MRAVVRLLVSWSMVGGMGCGDGSPTAPSPAGPAFGLRSGDYTLTIVVSVLPTGQPSCLETTAAVDRISIPVTVESRGSSWQVRPVAAADLGLVITFESPGRNALVGPVEGAARDPGSGVGVTIAALPALPGFATLGPPRLIGWLESENVGGGTVSAQVRFTEGSGARVCAANSWRLQPR